MSSSGAAEALGSVGVDGEQVALEVVGADHAERAFDELAVAGFALAEGGFGGALDGDVDAGGDDEADLPLLVAECGGGPGDAAEAAVAVEPLVLEDGGEGAGAEAVELLDGLGDFVAGDELVPGVAADEGGEVVSGGELAGAVEADDAAGGIEDGDEGADGVEDGGDEVALDGEGGLDALAGAGGAVYLADAGVELEAIDDLSAENGEGVGLGWGEGAGGGVEYEEGADADSVGGGEGGAGVEAEGVVAEDRCRPGRSRGPCGRREPHRRCRRGWWSRRGCCGGGLRLTSKPMWDLSQMRSAPMREMAAMGVLQICAASRAMSSRTGSGAGLRTS